MIISLSDKTTVVDSPKVLFEVLKAVLMAEDEIDRDKEHVWVIHLSARNTIKALELVSLGTISTALIHPREVFTRAVALRSSAIILAHNHPTGSFSPSEYDITVTERLIQAGEIIGIQVIDHLIISLDGYCSLKERGDVF